MSIVRRNVFALLSAQVATWSISFVMLVFVPHVVTPATYGRWGFASVLASFIALFAGLGMPQYITKEVARNDELVEPFVMHALALRWPLTIVLGAIALGGLSLLGYSGETRWLLVICCFSVLITGTNAMLVAVLQGQQRMRRTALWFMVERYVDAAGMIVALQCGLGIIAAAIASACSYFISLWTSWRQLAHRAWSQVRWQRQIFRQLVVGGSSFFLWNFVLTVYGSIDIMLLSLMIGDAAVGRYSLAYKLVSVPGAIPVLLSTALFPALAVASSSNHEVFTRLTQKALRISLLVSIPIALAFTILAPDILTFLRYPVSYQGAALPLRILALHVPLVGVDTLLGTALLATDKQRQWVTAGCIAAAFNPLANSIAIPLTQHLVGDGVVGAAVITVLTEVLMLIGALHLRPRGVRWSDIGGFASRCIMAAVPMAIVLFLTPMIWLPLRLGLSMMCYGAGALLSGATSITEVRQLLGETGRLGRRDAIREAA